MLINRLNRFMAMFIAMFMICAVPSCGFGDDEDEDDGIDMPQNPNAPQMLIGTWNMYGLKYTFNTDGTGYITGDFDADDLKTTANPLLSSRSGRSTIPFTYIYNEAEQTIVFNRDEEIWRIVNLTVDILVVIDSEGNELTLVKELPIQVSPAMPANILHVRNPRLSETGVWPDRNIMDSPPKVS